MRVHSKNLPKILNQLAKKLLRYGQLQLTLVNAVVHARGDAMKRKKSRTALAVEAKRNAWYDNNRGYPHLVPMYERQAKELIIPESPPMICNGEVVPMTNEGNWIRDTLANPDTPAIDSSIARTDLLEATRSLDVGIDAANTIDARNSLEKMLAHQMAACHVKAMNLIAESGNHAHSLEMQTFRLKQIAVAAKLMDVYQKGMDTLSRTRNAGKQTITVKQVHVSGGQNVIADNVTSGGVVGRGE
jgi:hypothetical protein